MKYVVARGKAEAKVDFDNGDGGYDDFNEAVERMNYENKYGYFKDFEHFVFEVEQRTKAKKLI